MGSPSSISLFLLEPKTCKYVLRVESPLICDLLEYADENGLLSEKFEADFAKLRITSLHAEQVDLDERIANGDEWMKIDLLLIFNKRIEKVQLIVIYNKIDLIRRDYYKT